MRYAVFYSAAGPLRKALAAVRAHAPAATLTVLAPPSLPLDSPELQEADDVQALELKHYGPRNPVAALRLIWRLRRARYDGFAVLFASPQLRVLAALSGARARYVCRGDGGLAPLPAGPFRAVAGELLRALRGRIRYCRVWLSVRLRRAQEP